MVKQLLIRGSLNTTRKSIGNNKIANRPTNSKKAGQRALQRLKGRGHGRRLKNRFILRNLPVMQASLQIFLLLQALAQMAVSVQEGEKPP